MQLKRISSFSIRFWLKNASSFGKSNHLFRFVLRKIRELLSFGVKDLRLQTNSMCLVNLKNLQSYTLEKSDLR
jgi:hypothetical protein